MDETSFLLPPRSCSSPSSASMMQPDRLLATDPGASRVPEAAALPRPRGLREIANLLRVSIPGSFVLPRRRLRSRACHPLTSFRFETSSHLLLRSTKLYPSCFHFHRRAARFGRTLRCRLLPHVGICDRLVLAPFASLLSIPRFATYRVDSRARRFDCSGHVRFPSIHRREKLHRPLYPPPALCYNALAALHPHRHHVGKYGAYSNSPWSRRGA
jgi:hypothetical protein